MSEVVLKISNVSKQYRLGVVGTGTFANDLKRWWYKILGKEDPFQKVGEVNNREVVGGEYVWALKNVSFEVKKGEIIGVIGKNGAGKSTLLKLLSRVTVPSTGEILVKGRIASLLEVGTGFHPELTGRENVFLNGAILGMTKEEINSKMDSIIEFSGVAKYIDTPVKRYSSGMMVRLGFSVAAHLEPEILIVDEVLAVGDAEFQQKCLDKLKSLSQSGITILLVSHNMFSVKSLCNKVVFLEYGTVKRIGPTVEVVDYYLKGDSKMHETGVVSESYISPHGTGEVRFTKVQIVDNEKLTKVLFFRQPIDIQFELHADFDRDNLMIGVQIITLDGLDIVVSESFSKEQKGIKILKGKSIFRTQLNTILIPGTYSISAGVSNLSGSAIHKVERVFDFEVSVLSRQKEEDFKWNKRGFVYELCNWEKLN